MDAEKVIGGLLLHHKLTLSVAESCTGGLVGNLITNIPGSSAYFLGGYITYSNEAKVSLLGVSEITLQKYGAVSEQTVLEMAFGARQGLHSDIGLSISGIAGPDGGTSEKPVGLVWIGLSAKNIRVAHDLELKGNRLEIKQQSAQQALFFLYNTLTKHFGEKTYLS
jgi:PncC family amidohydrolase